MPPSNIRVSVHWKQATVFAGEDVEATITFTNIAAPSAPSPLPSRFNEPNWDAPSRAVNSERARARKHPPTSGALAQRPGLTRHTSLNGKGGGGGGHRQALSLSTAKDGNGTVRAVSGPGGTVQNAQIPTAVARPKHGRTLSILSLGTDVPEVRGGGMDQRMMRGHARAASVQIPGIKSSGNQLSATSPKQPSPLLRGSSPSASSTAGQPNEYPFPIARDARRSPRSQRPSPRLPSSRESPASDFTFPQQPPRPSTTEHLDTPIEPDSAVSPMTVRPNFRSHSPRPPEGTPEPVRQVARILSDTSVNGTPRSSMDIYSQTNNSSETLASEYIQQPTNRWFTRPEPLKRSGSQRVPQLRSSPETLMMGYAQIMGSFIVDGSLVNQAPFEEVKRKGIVGGHGGGGVVGVERSKRESGLFGALGWGNIGESLSGILGGGELSSIKEMRGIASSKSIPLLSTPQSILFVDLRLGPGENRSYSYTFKLPRGLPPSHKGRAIKISYQLTIGMQRPGTAQERQHVKSVDVPFRVLGGVNSQGEILGHDLMSPYILLRDQARTASIIDPSVVKSAKQPNGTSKPPDSSLSDFTGYITHLLSKSETGSGPPSALLSPTAEVPSHRRRSSLDEPTTMKEAIDFAILRSNQTTDSGASRGAIRFEIARSGQRVAVINLARPSYRLGETIHTSIDFANADIPTYAVSVSLESSESIDPALALRSTASVARVTRRVHAHSAENVMFARRVGISLAVPWNAAPEFITTGVGVAWKVRVEFIGPRLETRKRSVLLGEVSRDHRGAVFSPIERLQCDSFEVEAPVRIYGAIVETGESTDVEDLIV
ncbi:Rgp1-domain-containing protein [Rhizodiscina lignyota]|uniref:Rgp1-domain-containing protein n=1 Tax=Rhizodiscina lignyota TaxID=1504668 RepID=A0A9P4M444_9PEZI|nr:Rgp1-domain-containing protein [Rhizodiscina lignyota]